MIQANKRTKGKNKGDYTLKDVYQSYKKEVIDQISNPIGTEKSLIKSKQELLNIWKDYLKAIMDAQIDNAEVYDLPFGLGRQKIQKMKIPISLISNANALKVDYEASKKFDFKRIIYHLNEHRDGCRYRFYWGKKHKVVGISLYSFIPTRTNKRRLAKILKETTQDYFE
jgi:hypothetical protein